jgi:hypothetical protein
VTDDDVGLHVYETFVETGAPPFAELGLKGDFWRRP